MNPRRIIQCYGWLVLLPLLSGGAVSAYYAKRDPALFEASATVVVGPSDRAGSYEAALRSLDTVSRRNVMATYAQIPSSRTAREGVLQELNFSRERSAGYGVRTFILPDTNVLRITVKGADPQRASEFANALVRESRKIILGIYGGIITFDVLDEAAIPKAPVDPEVARKTALGALCGLILGSGVVFLMVRFRSRSVHTGTEDIRKKQGLHPCIGQNA